MLSGRLSGDEVLGRVDPEIEERVMIFEVVTAVL
jgi:hypothetical protein